MKGKLKMKSILVSMYNKKGISSIVILYEGKLLERNVTRIPMDMKEETTYMQLLDTISKAMCLVRNIIQTKEDISKRVVFELNNVNVIKWFERSDVKKEYQEKFCEIVDTLEEMPIQYLFVYNKVPSAAKFAQDKYIKKVAVSTLDDDVMQLEDNEEQDLVVTVAKSDKVEKPKLSGI